MSDRFRLVGLVAFEVALVVALHAIGRLDGFTIGWSSPSTWIGGTSFDDAVGAVVLMVALVMSYWLLLSTLGYLAASMSGRRNAVSAVGLLTLPATRRLVSRAVALSLAASAVSGSFAPTVGGAGSAPVVVEVDESGTRRPPDTIVAPVDDEPSGLVLPPHLELLPPGDADDLPADERIPPARYPLVEGSRSHPVTVRRGDHLWSLSKQHLEVVLGRSDLGEHEIARYWVRVIRANRDTIRSGNPDLIYPGEVIVLPTVTSP